MGERTEQLKDQIETQRDELGESLHQLEDKVKDTMDWRSQFEQRPMVGIGVAFAGGFLLSSLLPSGSSKSDSKSYPHDTSNYRVNDESQGWRGANGGQQVGFASQPQQQRQSPEMKEINETVENIRGAVMGLAATRLRTFLADAVPGFEDEYEAARQKRGNSEATSIHHDNGETSSSHSSAGQSWPSQESRSRDGGASQGMPSEQQAGAESYRV